MKRVLAAVAYCMLAVAGIGALVFPPQTLWLGDTLTTLVGWFLLVGGIIGTVGVLTGMVYLKLVALLPLLAGAFSYAVTAGAILAVQPSRLLQTAALLALVALLALRGLDLLDVWRLTRRDRS